MRHFMGEEDVRRQKLNVFEWNYSEKVESVAAGSGYIKRCGKRGASLLGFTRA